MGFSRRHLHELESLDRRAEKRLPPAFGELEIGESFFYRDRIFIKIGGRSAVELGAEEVRHFQLLEEVTW
jgi:hypothetical protein